MTATEWLILIFAALILGPLIPYVAAKADFKAQAAGRKKPRPLKGSTPRRQEHPENLLLGTSLIVRESTINIKN